MADALEGLVRRLLSLSGALGRGAGGGAGGWPCSGGVPAVCPGLNRWQNKLLITLEKASGSAHLFMIFRSLRRSFFPVSSKPADCHPISPPRAAPLDIMDPNLGGGERQGGREVGRQGGHGQRAARSAAK